MQRRIIVLEKLQLQQEFVETISEYTQLLTMRGDVDRIKSLIRRYDP